MATTLRTLLAALDEAKQEDPGRCYYCGTKITAKQGTHHTIYVDADDDYKCWKAPTGRYDSEGDHEPGYVDKRLVAERAEALARAVAFLPDEVLDREVTES